MTLVLADQMALAELEVLRSDWLAGPLQIGLYQGDPSLSSGQDIGDVIPCPTPGADVLLPLPSWGAAYLWAGVARSDHPLLTWTCTGAGPTSYIGGYYVVAPGPVLAWRERLWPGGLLVGTAGQTVTVGPRRTHRSQLLGV